MPLHQIRPPKPHPHPHAKQHAEEKAICRASCTVQLAGYPPCKTWAAKPCGMRDYILAAYPCHCNDHKREHMFYLFNVEPAINLFGVFGLLFTQWLHITRFYSIFQKCVLKTVLKGVLRNVFFLKVFT